MQDACNKEQETWLEGEGGAIEQPQRASGEQGTPGKVRKQGGKFGSAYHNPGEKQ